jgi:hypothetical protein
MRGVRLTDLPVDVPFFQGLVTPPPADSQENKPAEGKLYIIQSPDINDRIRIQSGLFSVYVPARPEDDEWDHNKILNNPSRYPSNEVLLKLIIPKQKRMEMQRELEHLGMLPDQIFPDLEGIGMFLQYWRTRRINARGKEKT